VHALVLAAALLAELHHRADLVLRAQDGGADVGLADLGDPRRVGHVRRVVDGDDRPVGERELELDGRHRRHELEVVLALEALAHDVHVQQAQEPAAEAEAERVRGLGLPGQRCVVEGELLQRVAQVGVVVRVDGEQPAEHHGLDVPVARQGLVRGVRLGGQRVADAQAGDVLDPRDEVAHLAGAELVRRGLRGGEEADVVDLGLRRRRHGVDGLALGELAVHDPDVGDDPAVLVVLRVEDEGAGRRGGVAAGSGDAGHELLEHVGHALARLGGDAPHRVRVLPDQLGDLLGHPLGLGAGEVDLVQAGDELEAGVDREVGVGDGLGLHALGGVDHEQRALARRERARDLVGEVHVPGRVDEVQLVGLAVARLVEHAHGLRLDGDPALALEVHGVEELRAHGPGIHRVGHLEDAIRQRRLAVVDVGDDREVADVRLVHASHATSGAAPREAAGPRARAGARRRRRTPRRPPRGRR